MMQLKNIRLSIENFLKKTLKEEVSDILCQNDLIENLNNNNKNLEKQINVVSESNNSLKEVCKNLTEEIEMLKKENTLIKTSFITIAQDMALISEALSQIFTLSKNPNLEEIDYIEEDIEEIEFVDDIKKKNKKKIYH